MSVNSKALYLLQLQRIAPGLYRTWVRCSFDGEERSGIQAHVTRTEQGAWYWTLDAFTGQRPLGGEDHYRTRKGAAIALHHALKLGFKFVPQLGWCLREASV